MVQPLKLEAVKRVFPDLNRGELTNEQAAQKIEAETGVQVAPGYLKHIFSGRNSQKGRTKPMPSNGQPNNRLAGNVLLSSVRGSAAETIRETVALAKKVGGLTELRELVNVLIEMGVTEDIK